MAKSILITVCLANDMVCPVEKNQPLPNTLHIGYYESVRLLGTEWKKGPLIKFLQFCHGKQAKDLSIIHMRDWHNPKDPLQKYELEKYGPHCMENTWGAKFVWEAKGLLPEKTNAHILNSKKIMTATEPEFVKLFKKVIGNTPKEEIKIGIIGVLTNIKVQQMAIGLQGLFDINNIAICSALCASNNVRRHFQGLDDLSNLYGVKVFDSIKQFSTWLNVKTSSSLTMQKFDVPTIKILDGKSLDKDQINIITYLFKECKSIKLKPLFGGFSGAQVYYANSSDRHGFEEVPTVVKLDRMENIGKERVGFEKLQHILGSHLPKIVDSIETEKGAGIRYSFTMMNKKTGAKTFKEFYESLDGKNKKDMLKLEEQLNILSEEIFDPLYANWTLDQKQLWASNTFKIEYLGGIKAAIKKILGYLPYDDTITMPNIGKFYNPALFYTEQNITARLNEPVVYVRQSLAHGDLNATNILMDDNKNVWLIDFYHSDYDYHVIQDIAKLENDLKFLHTPINSEKELLRLVEFEKLLMSQKKLSEPIKNLPKNLAKNNDICKLHKAVKMLRAFAFKVSNDTNMRNYRIPQLRYSGHTLNFEEATLLQKKYALISTALLCEYFGGDMPRA